MNVSTILDKSGQTPTFYFVGLQTFYGPGSWDGDEQVNFGLPDLVPNEETFYKPNIVAFDWAAFRRGLGI